LVIAQVAQVALVHDLPVVALLDPVHFHGRAGVDQVEQRRESGAQADAAAAAVADVVHPRQLLGELRFVVVLRLLPLDRVAGGGF
jgi:hypothetical protein